MHTLSVADDRATNPMAEIPITQSTYMTNTRLFTEIAQTVGASYSSIVRSVHFICLY